MSEFGIFPQQNLFWAIVSFPFRLLWAVVIGIGKLLLLPLRLIIFVITLPFKILRAILARLEFYIENIQQTFKVLWCLCRAVLVIMSGIFITILIPLYLILLGISHIVFKSTAPFDVIKAFLAMLATFTLTELVLLILAIVGFVVLFAIAFLLISIYSPIQAATEVLSFATANRIVLIVMFILTLMVVVVLYVVLSSGFFA